MFPGSILCSLQPCSERLSVDWSVQVTMARRRDNWSLVSELRCLSNIFTNGFRCASARFHGSTGWTHCCSTSSSFTVRLSVRPSVSWVSLCHIVRTDVYNSSSKLPIEWVGDEVSHYAKMKKGLEDIFLSVGGFQGIKLGSLLINMN